MSVHYQVRLFAEIKEQKFYYSCLIANGGNRKHPWGTCHKEGPWHRFSSQEAATKALNTYLNYDPAKIYRWGRVFRITADPVGTKVAPSWRGELGYPADQESP